MINQFRTIDDLREEIKELENILMRPTPRLSHPTLYRKRDVSEGEVIIKGVRGQGLVFVGGFKMGTPA